MTDEGRELIGRTLGGRFRLTAFLGEGAMASVYRGEQDGDPREVAVKVMHTELLADATFAKRFTREAKAAARIVHPNSVKILEHGADGRHLYLAMELLEGQDLFELLARERRLPQLRAAGIVAQICGALTAAHAHGIVHRDLKPENVMILPDPRRPGADLVKVLDFGIAKILERERSSEAEGPPSSEPIESAPPSSALTRVGGLVGTPEYMSPEQAMGLDVDARSDVYSCGALLFHAVTGKQPFTGNHPLEVLMKIPDTPPPAPSSLVPGIHPEMERIILRALAKAPHDRQQSAAELGAELAAFVETSAASAHTPRAAEAAVARPAPPSSGSVPTAPKGKPEARAAFASDAGDALPGVPGSVMINVPKHPSDPPPDTLRSVSLGNPVAVPPVSLGNPVGVPQTSPGSSGNPDAPRASVGIDERRASPEPAAESRPVDDRPEAPLDESTVMTRARPTPGQARAFPRWAVIVGVLVLAAIIWLVRRFEAGVETPAAPSAPSAPALPPPSPR